MSLIIFCIFTDNFINLKEIVMNGDCMDLNKDEKLVIKKLIERQLQFFKGEEVKRDVPIKFLQAEEKNEEFLKNLLKKFE